jgi:hypothetical protein
VGNAETVVAISSAFDIQTNREQGEIKFPFLQKSGCVLHKMND